jgi:Fic family protein
VKVPLTPPRLSFSGLGAAAVDRVLAAAVDDSAYLHWDDVFHRAAPEGLTTNEWWLALKFQRRSSRRRLALRPVTGPPFTFTLPDRALEMMHKVDQQAAGRIAASDTVMNPAMRDKYVLSSLAEEAITSSQLEGASTSRRVAKEMLRTGRPPRDKGEQMIANNFLAMQFVRDHIAEPLTPDLVLEIQRIVTEGTLDDSADAGRLQQPDDVRVRVWGDNDQVLHTPPPAEELPERLDAMCEFANGGGEGFVHPVARAILLHFWLGYDHPFADGNGRTARILFYWSMLRQGYWLTEFISISRILRGAPSKYARSFLLVETDDNDLTYFLLYHLEVVLRAIRDLMAYVERKSSEVRSAERLVKSAGRLNHRQLDLVSHALRNPDATYTVESHRRSHGVAYETARSDLLDLAGLGLLTQGKIGKAFRFSPAPDIEGRLRAV